MPTQNWIDAASRADRQPVLQLAIGTINAQYQLYKQADWDASSVKTNVNTASAQDNPGSVILVTNGIEAHAGTYDPVTITSSSSPVALTGNQYVGWLTAVGSPNTYTYPVAGGNNRVCGCTWNADFSSPASIVMTFAFQGSNDGGATWQTLLTQTRNVTDNENYTVSNLTPGTWQFRVALVTGGGSFTCLTINSVTPQYQTTYQTPGFLHTPSIDVGGVIDQLSVVNVQQDTGSGGTLTFQVIGSNDNATWSAPLVDQNAALSTHGTAYVGDGSQVTPYRYYQFLVTFASPADSDPMLSHMATPILKQLGITGGTAQFKYYSTHPGTPESTALPYLLADISPLSTTLELMKLGSTGEVSPKVYYLQDTMELIRDGFLRNKSVQLLCGFVGLDQADYEPVFTGLWYDGSIDLDKNLINIKTRTIFSLFQKVQLPAEKAMNGIRDSLTCPPWVRINKNIMSTMIDLLNALGVPGRFIDSASFQALSATGAPFDSANTDWNVSRKVDKDNKVDAVKMLEELSVLSGVFVLPQTNGRITACHYDPTAPMVAQISTDVAKFGPVQLGQGTLYTRQQILYNPRHQDDLQDGVARGTWANGQVYPYGSRVIDTLTGNIYHCHVEHTSSDDSQPGYGAGWRSFWIKRWVGGQPYSPSSPALLSDPEMKVVHNYKVFYCIQAMTGLETPHPIEPEVTPGANAYWSLVQEIVEAGESLTAPWTDPWLWQINTSYQKADTIYYYGVLYRCIQGHTSGIASDGSVPSRPDGSTGISYWATEWVAGTVYGAGRVVTMQGPLYTVSANHTADSTNKPGTGLNYQLYWYSSPIKPGTSAQDFYNAFVLVNNEAEVNWNLNLDVPAGDPNYQVNPGYQQNWYDMWNASTAARAALAARMDSWFANPKMRITASELPPAYYEFPVGSMVGVNGLMLPILGAQWGVPCQSKKFMVMKSTFDTKKCIVSWDLLEMPIVASPTGWNPAVLAGSMVISPVALIFSTGHQFVDGQTVKVSGVSTDIDGTYTIGFVDNNTIMLNGCLVIATTFNTNGLVTLVV